MSLSPTKHRPLSRQPSSPSLAVGLSPRLPDYNIMNPSSSSRSLKRSRSHHRVHRGDVSSSAASSPYHTEDEDAHDLMTPLQGETNSRETTPKRRVVNTIEPATVGRTKNGSKRTTLQERLQAVAKVKKSRSIGDGLGGNNIPPVPSLPISHSKANITSLPSHTSGLLHDGSDSKNKNDKVVVCVRMKPTTSSFSQSAYEVTPTSLTLSDSHPNVQKRGGKSGREEEYTYTFDKMLQFPATTPDLYESKVAPLVEKAMNGFNSTIFAYGQTGSGKSFTMTGTESELGIIPCAVDGVFDAINAESDRAFLLRVSYIEIYNETLRDLLNFRKGPLKEDEKPVIHTSKGKVYVDPLIEEVVSSPQDIVNLLAKGNHGRKIGATDWNERSSRSHCVFTIVIESRPRDGESGDDIRLSRLNLIDLAGSEKAVSDMERRGEGKHINKSLLALREVINKLTDKKRMHVPYRDSKLTHLLENALGGDSNICVICTMSAEEEHCAETLETLKFAGRCSQVETQAKKNILLSDERALIKAKDKEIEVLKKRLKSLADSAAPSTSTSDSSEQITDLADSVAAMEARKDRLRTQLAKLNNEILTSEDLPRSATGLPLSPPKPKRRRISDFNFLGMGTPKRPISDRRAVSGMTRLTEENMPSLGSTFESVDDIPKTFDHDRTIAALRRALTAKQQELSSVTQELTAAIAHLAQQAELETEMARLRASLETLQTQYSSLESSNAEVLADHEAKMREAHVQLESTRTELVSTINEKAAKVDELESAILDLRKSREDLVIEDQQRYDEVQSQLGKAVEEQTAGARQSESMQVALSAEQQLTGELKRQLEDSKRIMAEESTRHKADLDDVASQHTEVQAALLAARSQIQLLEDTAKTLQSELETSRNGQSELSRELSEVKSEKDLAEQARKNAVTDLESYQRAAMASESQAIAELREEITRLRKEKEEQTETARKDAEAQKHALKEEKRLRGEAVRIGEEEKGKVVVAHQELEDLQARFAEVEKREAKLRQSQGDSSIREKQLLSELDQLKTASTQAVDIERRKTDDAIQQLDALKSQLHAVEEREQEVIRSLEETTLSKSQLDAEITDIRSATDRSLDEQTLRVKELEKQLASEMSKRAEFELREADVLKATSEVTTKRNELQGDIVRLNETISQNQRKIAELEKRLAGEEARRTEVELREAELLKSTDDESAKRNELQGIIARLNESAAQHQQALSQINEALEQEKNARRVAEAHVKSSEVAANKQVETITALEIDCNAMRQAVGVMQRELDEAKRSAATSADRATDLAREVAELKATASLPSSGSFSVHRTRHTVSASDPSMPPASVVEHLRTQALTSASTGVHPHTPALKLMTKEREEIERLEKVVEAQKVIIDEQREKILMWAKEIEQQREIVRALTDSVNNSSPSHHGSRRISHGKSKSISGTDSPRTSGYSAVPKKPFPSTFTAFNLALPTTPTPLPMHPSQFDNTSGKKGRRVTIDHDMNKLSESSKVNKARAMFEQGEGTPVSPTETPVRTHTRAHSTMMASAPHQRRP